MGSALFLVACSSRGAAASKSGYVTVLELVESPSERVAIESYTSTITHGAEINAALATDRRVYLSAGLGNIDTDTGIISMSGSSIGGDGLMRTILKAAA